MKVVLEIADGAIIGITADVPDVALIVIDYDFDGPHEFDGQTCRITRYSADENSAAVEAISALPSDEGS